MTSDDRVPDAPPSTLRPIPYHLPHLRSLASASASWSTSPTCLGRNMKITRSLISSGVLFMAAAYMASGCALDAEDEDEEDTDSSEVRVLPATANEVVPAYGVNSAAFPQPFSSCATRINEYKDLRSHNAPYVRIDFFFEPGMIFSRDSLAQQYNTEMAKAAEAATKAAAADIAVCPSSSGNPEIVHAVNADDVATSGVYILPIIMPMIECKTRKDTSQSPPVEYCVGVKHPLSKGKGGDLDDLRRFAKNLAELYGPGGDFWKEHPTGFPIRAWEIGNEVNSTIPHFYVGPPDEYKRILQAAYKGLRQGDPRARILLGGSYGFLDHKAIPADEFLGKVFEHGNGRCLVDAVAYHPYAEKVPGAVRKTEKVVNAITDHVVGLHRERDVQIWITELGWGDISSNPNPPPPPLEGPWVANDSQLADYIQQFVTAEDNSHRDWRLGPTLWYSYLDATNYTNWAGFDGVSQRPETWAAISEIGASHHQVQLPPIHRCPSRKSH